MPKYLNWLIRLPTGENGLKNLVKKVTKDQRQKSCLKNKNKAFSEYSERSRRRIKNVLKSDCQVALDFLGLYELIPTKVEYYNHLEGSYESITLIDEAELKDSTIIDEAHDEITNEQLLYNVYLLF